MEGNTTTAPRSIAIASRRESQGPRHPRRHPHAASRSSRSSGRPPPDERQALARFGGFGAVALSIFPDPVTGRYKDAGWQALGEELQVAADARGIRQRQAHHLQRLLHLARSSSRPCTSALARLGVPDNATVLEPGCGTGNFMSHGPGGHAVHRRRAGLHLRPHRPRAPPRPRHPHRELPRHPPARSRRRGDRQRAVRRRQARLSTARSCRCTISSSPSRSTP